MHILAWNIPIRIGTFSAAIWNLCAASIVMVIRWWNWCAVFIRTRIQSNGEAQACDRTEFQLLKLELAVYWKVPFFKYSNLMSVWRLRPTRSIGCYGHTRTQFAGNAHFCISRHHQHSNDASDGLARVKQTTCLDRPLSWWQITGGQRPPRQPPRGQRTRRWQRANWRERAAISNAYALC